MYVPQAECWPMPTTKQPCRHLQSTRQTQTTLQNRNLEFTALQAGSSTSKADQLSWYVHLTKKDSKESCIAYTYTTALEHNSHKYVHQEHRDHWAVTSQLRNMLCDKSCHPQTASQRL